MTGTGGMSAKERAYRDTKARILDGSLPGGDLITEGQVADALAMSRTPVREAFLRLEAEGLLRLFPKRGALVVAVSPSEVEAVLEARELVEGHALTKLCGSPEADRSVVADALNEVLDIQRAALAAEDEPAFAEADRRFHITLVESARNMILLELYASLRDRQLRMNLGSLDRGPHRPRRDPRPARGDRRRARPGRRRRGRAASARAPRRHARRGGRSYGRRRRRERSGPVAARPLVRAAWGKSPRDPGGNVPVVRDSSALLASCLAGRCPAALPDRSVPGPVRCRAPTHCAEVTRMPGLTLAEARRMLDAGLAEADRIGQPMNVAILDAGGHLLAFARQDGAIRASIDISQRKASTALLMEAPTAALMPLVQPGAELYGLEQTAGGMVVFGGGIPVQRDGELVGAVGVSAGSAEQDVQVAEAAVAAVKA